MSTAKQINPVTKHIPVGQRAEIASNLSNHIQKAKPVEKSQRPTCKLETITPQKARDWLKLNVRNRNVGDDHVRRLILTIREGRWKLNGETIKFDFNGHLVDGQHRLLAVAAAGESVESFVVRGLEPETFDTVDIGIIRSVKNLFVARGEANAGVLASAAAMLWRHENGKVRSRGKTGTGCKWQLLEIPDNRPGFRECCHLSPALKKVLPESVAGAYRYLFGKKDKEQAEKFFELLASGEGLFKSNPIYTLREKCMELKTKKIPDSQPAICEMTIKAWNAVRQNKEIKRLVHGDEKFPDII